MDNRVEALSDLDALGEKVQKRLPGVKRILQEMCDSGDPDRIAEGAFLTGAFDDIADYVDVLRDLADV
jgi:hypothetical protein